MGKTEITYVLPDAPVKDAQVIPGVPGVWMPGEVKTASELGVDPAEMDSLIAAEALPIQRGRADAPAAPADAQPTTETKEG